MKQFYGLAVALVATFAAGVLGSLATRRAPEFYGALVQPSWAPPSWLFGPVWSTLYVLMGVAAWLVWKQGGTGVRVALLLFGVQLILNGLWSWLFFAWRRGALAEIEIVILLVMIVATALAFWRVRPIAGLMLVPYLAWVTFASALTFALVSRNPDVL